MEKFAVEFSWVLTDAIRTSTFIMALVTYTEIDIVNFFFFVGGGWGAALIWEWKK